MSVKALHYALARPDIYVVMLIVFFLGNLWPELSNL